MDRPCPTNAAPDSQGDASGRLFFPNPDPLADARPPVVWLGVRGSGRRRIARLGRRLDPPVVPRWPAPALALMAMLACGAGGANNAALGVLAAEISLILAACILYCVRLPRLLMPDAWVVPGLLLGFLVWTALPALPGPLRGGVVSHLLAPDRFWPTWLADAGLTGVFLAAAAVGFRPKNSEVFAIWLTAFAGLLIAGSLVLRVLGPSLGWPFALEDERLHRFAASVGNPNAAGIVFAMLGLVAAALARVWASRWVVCPGDRVLLGAIGALAVALSTCAMVGITQSRMALGLLLAGLCVQHFTGKGGPARWRGWRLGLQLVAVACLLLAAGATLDRFAPVEVDSVSRGGIWLHYLALAGRAPITGYGLGAFAELNAATLDPLTAPALWSFGSAHAEGAQLALEAGWPGLLLLAAALVLVGRRVWRLLGSGADPLRQSFVLAALVAFVAGMFDIALNVPCIALLATMLVGLCWGRALRGNGWLQGGAPRRG